MARSSLSPGQALTLLDPNTMQDREAVKVTLVWLLAHKHLVASVDKKSWSSTRSTRLRLGVSLPVDASRDLQSMIGIVRSATSGFIDDVVKAGRAAFGTDLEGFTKLVVLPSLIEQKLVRQTRERLLVLFERNRYERTPAGEATCSRIQRLIEDARKMPEYLDENAAQAVAMAASLGGLIFLIPELRPHFGSIAEVMRRSDGGDSSDGGGSSSYRPTGPGAPERDRGEAEADALDFGALDPSGLDDLDASLDMFDMSFDAAAGHSGGDAGTGD